MLRPIIKGVVALAAITALVLGGYKILERPMGGPCWALKDISSDPKQNEYLKMSLTKFLNDPVVRNRLDGTHYFSNYLMGSERILDLSFPWKDIFDRYPEFDFFIKNHEFYFFILLDSEHGTLSVPYKVKAVGVYVGRSALMFKSESDSQYSGGSGNTNFR